MTQNNLTTTEKRINAVQDWLKEQQLDAFLLPHEDEFLNEYLPDHNERIKWLTGFSGSAGCVIITQTKAIIFTDGRYTLQVRKQVPNFFNFEHLAENPPLHWLNNFFSTLNTPEKRVKIGIDPNFHSYHWYQNGIEQLQPHQLITINNPIDLLWQDRPAPKLSNAVLMSDAIAGKSALQKRIEISDQLTQNHIDALLINQADSLCWLLNMRGSDIPHIPVILAHALLHACGKIDLFIDAERLSPAVLQHIAANDLDCPVSLYAPDQLTMQLQKLSNKSILVDTNNITAGLVLSLEQAQVKLIDKKDPIQIAKACKNETEINGMKQCHIKDAVAMVRFLSWVDSQVTSGQLVNEAQLSDKLTQFRQLEPSLIDLSFNSISAVAANAALCHYNHNDNPSPAQLELGNVYLIDSGGQYQNGTTDITRTIAIGSVDHHIKKMFTLVLKGHIALNQSIFPQGTIGMQLDSFARQFLWQQGYDFDHGTGHGVGHCLSVHEGPQNISKRPVIVPLQAGMVLSNEPGYYYTARTNDTQIKEPTFNKEFGIRIENLELVVNKNDTIENTEHLIDYLGFETLTYVPIDKNLISVEMLTPNEIKWLNDYHQKVWDKLHLLIDGDQKQWLIQATSAI